jgi:hypothetical protein
VLSVDAPDRPLVGHLAVGRDVVAEHSPDRDAVDVEVELLDCVVITGVNPTEALRPLSDPPSAGFSQYSLGATVSDE